MYPLPIQALSVVLILRQADVFPVIQILSRNLELDLLKFQRFILGVGHIKISLQVANRFHQKPVQRRPQTVNGNRRDQPCCKNLCAFLFIHFH